jgi:hypothetical protein
MPETHKNPEVDSAAGLHAEFEGVSPRSSDQTHGRVGRIHHDGPKHERPFKIPADVFLSSVLENREKEISPYHHPNQFFGEFTLAWMKDKYRARSSKRPTARDNTGCKRARRKLPAFYSL